MLPIIVSPGDISRHLQKFCTALYLKASEVEGAVLMFSLIGVKPSAPGKTKQSCLFYQCQNILFLY